MGSVREGGTAFEWIWLLAASTPSTKFVMVVEMVFHGLCLAPLAYLFAAVLALGFMGVWISATIYVGLLGMIMAVKFWLGGWKSIKV